MTGLKKALRSRRGFTLVELVVVLVIAGITASFAVPALTGYIDNAKEKQAVSETQVCVMAATRIAAQKYAEWQQATTNNSLGANIGANDASLKPLASWAGNTSDTPPTVTGGDVALTEGSGQYLLRVSKWESGGWSFTKSTSSITNAASVSGKVETLTCSSTGRVVYLVYTSKDGITVVYTNSGSTTTVKADDDLTVVPTPEPTAAPNPTPTPPTKETIEVTFKKISSYTGRNLKGATLQLTKAEDSSFRQEWTTTDSANKINLSAGNYTLTEIFAPAGYNLASSITFTISKDANNKLTVSGGSEVFNRIVTMTDPVRTSPFKFWAKDENGNYISGMYLQITGGELSKRPSTDGNKDTEWESKATEGHTLDLPLAPGTYTFQIDNDHENDQNPLYDLSNRPKVEITVAADGTITYSGDKDEWDVENDDSYTNVSLIFKKKEQSKNAQLVIDDSGIRVTIDNIQPWPITKKEDTATIQQGQFYYYDSSDGSRTFYSVCANENKNINGYWALTPMQNDSLCSVAATGSTRVFTDSTMNRFEGDLTMLREVRSGDLYYHNGILYMFCNTPGNFTNNNAPENDTQHWINLSKLGYKIDISIKEIPVSIQLVDADTGNPINDYEVVLKNPSEITKNQYNTDKTGALLNKWKIVATSPYECNLVPGTYKLIAGQGYDDQIHEKLDAKFTVADGDVNVNQNITVKLSLKKKDVTATVVKENITGGTSAFQDYSFYLTGTASNGQTVSIMAITNDKGIATFKNVPYGTNYIFKAIIPSGYNRSEGIWPFQVDNGNPGQSFTITFKK